MTGYALEMKRNYECSTSRSLAQLVHLGHVDSAQVYQFKNGNPLNESTPPGAIEREA